MYMDMGIHFFQQMGSTGFHSELDKLARIDASLSLITITNNIGKALIKGYEEYLEDYALKIIKIRILYPHAPGELFNIDLCLLKGSPDVKNRPEAGFFL